MSAVVNEDDDQRAHLDKDIQILQTVKQTKQVELIAIEKEFHTLAQAIMQYDMEKRKENNEKVFLGNVLF